MKTVNESEEWIRWQAGIVSEVNALGGKEGIP